MVGDEIRLQLLNTFTMILFDSSVATIMRGAGFNPSEAQIEDIITAVNISFHAAAIRKLDL